MAILENVEIWWLKADPMNPVKNRDADKPDQWEVSVRTTNKELALRWAKDNVRFKPLKRKVREEDGSFKLDDMGEEIREIVKNEKGEPYFAVSLRKKVTKANGEPSAPVKIMGGMNDLDPGVVGNGSIANVRVFQYPYTYQKEEGIANVLMAIQVTKLIKYEKEEGEAFAPVEMEIIGGGSLDEEEVAPKPKKKPARAVVKDVLEDLEDEIPF